MSVIVVMGVSGSGKSTLAKSLARELGGDFLEGDEFHPPENVEHMRAGKPLDDAMRRPWLIALGTRAAEIRAAGGTAVVSCSALKRSYRDILREVAAPVSFLFLDVPEALLMRRMTERKNHYMPPSLLASQLATLEPPTAAEPDCARLDGALGRADVFAAARAALSAGQQKGGA